MLQTRSNNICEKFSNENIRSSHYFTTFFFTKLMSEGPKAVQRYFDRTYRNQRKVNFFDKDKLFCPIHLIQKKHWALAVVYVQLKKIM
jgi:Ulp1 family protease